MTSAESGVEQALLPVIAAAIPARRVVHGAEMAQFHACGGERLGDDRRLRAPSDAVRPCGQRTRSGAHDLAQYAGASLARRRGALEHEHHGPFTPALLARAQVGQHRAEKRIDLIDAAGQDSASPPARDRSRRPHDRQLTGHGRCVERERQRLRAGGNGRRGRHRVHHRVREDQRRQAGRPRRQIAIGELDRRAEIAELRPEHEPDVVARPELGVVEREAPRGNGQLTDA